MAGNKTTARRTRRPASARPAPAAQKKVPAKVRVAKPGTRVRTGVATSLTPLERLRMVEIAAFFRAERRGFAPGYEVEDWLAAEVEVAAQLAALPAKKPAPRTRKPRAN
jgi:hypothetical protein